MLSTEENIANTKLAIEKWKDVPASDVVPELKVWTCGAAACFGGHVTTWPEFQTQGVKAGTHGMPQMFNVVGNRTHGGTDVALHLFGDHGLFCERETYFEDMCSLDAQIHDTMSDKEFQALSDHELVTLRLKTHLTNLERT